VSGEERNERNERRFDPTRYLRKLGKGDYLEVKWRLSWLRTEHPDAAIETELVHWEKDPPMAVFKAKVTIPGGGSATGWGQEELKDFGDYLEKAETKALGRALAALGYGTQFCEDHEFGAATSSPAPGVGRPRGPGGPARTPPSAAPVAHGATGPGPAGARGTAPAGRSQGGGQDGGLSAAIRALGGTEIGRVAVEPVGHVPAGDGVSLEVYLVDGRVHATRHHSPKAGTYYRALATCPHGHNAYPMARLGQDGALTPWRHRLPDGSLCTAPEGWTTTLPKDVDQGEQGEPGNEGEA